jgi:hypothetical protein
MPNPKVAFEQVKVHSWEKILRRSNGWGIDHSPMSYHRSEATAKAWRIFNRIRGIRMTLNEAKNG